MKPYLPEMLPLKSLDWVQFIHLDAIFRNPIFNSSQFVEETGIPRASAKRLLLELRQNKILTLVKDAAGKQPAILQFSKLLEIVG